MRNSTFGPGPRAALVNSSTYGGKIREVVKDQYQGKYGKCFDLSIGYPEIRGR
jgi:hypothetical protein